MSTDPLQQAEFWNGPRGQQWAKNEARYDAMFRPFQGALLASCAGEAATRIVEIGCGTGATALAVARAHPEAEVWGVDISRPILEKARLLCREEPRIRLVEADAQRYVFPEGYFDLALSQFGVMFFPEPVAAFHNIKGALRPGGNLRFVCWQSIQQNEWLWVPAQAAARCVALPAPPPPGTPGPFAFAFPENIQQILTQSGFLSVSIQPIEASILLGGDGELESAVEIFRATNLAGAMFKDASPAEEEAALSAVREALEAHKTQGKIRMGAAAWLVSAAG